MRIFLNIHLILADFSKNLLEVMVVVHINL